eukprot:TRINITY_DN32946_c0_g1_i1.p1 TRINITY_DN32946_c0_g1~~TRINITY_DN32946_c0_g1_i1.p1  ORF type:complete len:404 (-),score=158.80 TRINITY_DN32946_c0_g1_i1:334-1545(-)
MATEHADVAPTPAAGETAAGVAGLAADFLGSADAELDELKDAAIPTGPSAKKKAKLTHALLFDDPKGIKHLVETMPKLRFRGKGREFEDLKLLLTCYRNWFQELFPSKENLEDMAFKAVQILGEREKTEDGDISDPVERLHTMRYEYKSGGGVGTVGAQEAMKKAAAAAAFAAKASANAAKISEEMRLRIDANRQKALELQRKKALERGDDEAVARIDAQAQAAKIESNRQRAIEIKKRKAEQEAAAALEADEAAFAELAATQQAQPARAAASSTSVPRAPATCLDDEDDVFGFGGGMDDDFGAPARPATSTSMPAASAAKPAAATFLDEEDDVFGFGGSLDDDDFGFGGPPPAKQVTPSVATQASAPTPASGQKAATAAPAASTCLDEEDDVFGFGFDMDDM